MHFPFEDNSLSGTVISAGALIALAIYKNSGSRFPELIAI